MNKKTIGFIGFGLMAGSIAKCLRKAYPNITMLALNNRYPTVKPGLKMALDDGVLDALEPDLNGRFHNCDLIFLCAPVLTNISYLPALKKIMRKDCLLTDVGSTKGSMEAGILEAGLGAQFVGGHPMAGIEKTGYEHASAEMLAGAFYLFTPTEFSKTEDIETMKEIAAACKCRTLTLSAKEHDIAAAAISHVPHILSYSLVNTVREHDNDKQYMKQFAAGGFRDMTRIAASSPEMWQNIVQDNKTAVLQFLSQYQIVLEEFKQMLVIDDTEGIRDFFQKSKDYRDTFRF